MKLYECCVTYYPLDNSNHQLNDLLVGMDAIPKSDGSYNYVIKLVFNHKAYIASPQDMGDWYDVDFVVALLNKILSDCGRTGRFNLILHDDQMAQMMFGPETQVKMFVQKYKL